MRYGLDDRLWVVVDPNPQSTLGDILFQASLRELSLQFMGGLTAEENPTLFSDQKEAEAEAYGRLVAMRAAVAIAGSGAVAALRNAARVELRDSEGRILFEKDLRIEAGS